MSKTERGSEKKAKKREFWRGKNQKQKRRRKYGKKIKKGKKKVVR